MKLKVCGITSVAQMEDLQDLGVDYAGMIFYPKSARYAAEKLQSEKEAVKKLAIKKIGVFVNATIDDVKREIKNFGLSAVQLHGDEDVEFCKTLMQEAEVIKVFRISDQQNIDELVAPFVDACHYFLFDTDTKAYGGSGKQFNWQVLKEAKINKPFFLSGGIGPDDVEKIKHFKNPFVFALDVNSRFETEPGVKDILKIKKFISELTPEVSDTTGAK